MNNVVVENQITPSIKRKKIKAYRRQHRRPGGPYAVDTELQLPVPIRRDKNGRY